MRYASVPSVLLCALTLAVSLNAATRSVTFQQGLNGYTSMQDAELRDPSRNWFGGPVDTLLEVSEF